MGVPHGPAKGSWCLMATFSVKRGDSWAKDFVRREKVTNGLDPASGAIIPYPVGTTARMHVRDPRTNAIRIALSSTASGLTVTAETGTISVSIPYAQTETLSSGVAYPFDIELTYPDGTRSSTKTQYLKIVQDVTYGVDP